MDARFKVYSTDDGKFSLTVRYVAGEPRAWISSYAPDYQSQASFPPSIEKELCELVFKEPT